MVNPGRSAQGESRGKPCADFCGTSFPFADYLCKPNPKYKSTVGAGKDNEGVAANGQRTKGAIRDVGYSNAKKNEIA